MLNIVDILITIAVLTPIAMLLAAAGYIGYLVLFRRWTIYTLRTDEPALNPGPEVREDRERPAPPPARSEPQRAPAAQQQAPRRRRRRRR